MPRPAWPDFLRPRPATSTPASFRLVFGALSGAALSFSYTGFYLSIYSWISRRSPPHRVVRRTAARCFWLRLFACRIFYALVRAVDRHSSRRTWRTFHRGWLGHFIVDRRHLGLAHRHVRLDRKPSMAAQSAACVCGSAFVWVTFEFLRAHLPEIGFPWNLLGYPASGKSWLLQITTITGIYGLSFLVAAFNASWRGSMPLERRSHRARVLDSGDPRRHSLVMLFTPQLVPISHPNHSARVVQLEFSRGAVLSTKLVPAAHRWTWMSSIT